HTTSIRVSSYDRRTARSPSDRLTLAGRAAAPSAIRRRRDGRGDRRRCWGDHLLLLPVDRRNRPLERRTSDHPRAALGSVRDRGDARWYSDRGDWLGSMVPGGRGITRQCSGPSRRVSFLWFENRRGAGSATDRHYVIQPR